MSRSKKSFDILMQLWPMGKVLNRLGGLPLLGPLLQPCFGPEGNEAIIIPVQEAVRGAESVVLPFHLLPPLIEEASARTILNQCLCRRGESCQIYPQDIGCLFLGDGACDINPTVGWPASLSQAIDHAQRAIAAGLAPLVVHSAFDAWMLGIPYRRSLAICFCCDCCCSIRQGLKLGPPAFWDTVIRLPGLSVTVGPSCTGCGSCLQCCPVGAISLTNGQARISELCKGCGRCATACPNEAIVLRVAEDADLVDRLYERLALRTDLGSQRADSTSPHSPDHAKTKHPPHPPSDALPERASSGPVVRSDLQK